MNGEYYVLVDADHHRDDVLRLFWNSETAIRQAIKAVEEATRGTNRTVEDQLSDGARRAGWLFLTTIGSDGDSVSVRKVMLE